MSGTIDAVGIITADRPEMLQRALESHLDQERTYGHRPRLIVVDGSRRDVHRRGGRVVAAALAAKYERSIEYVGATEAEALHRTLSASCDPDIVTFGLTPGKIGSNRNLLLAITAGSRLVMFDDDMILEGWTPEGVRDGLTIAGHEDVKVSAYFPTRAAAVAEARRGRPVDVIGTHGRLLGTAVSMHEPLADRTRMCEHVARVLDAGRDVRVRVTFSGLAGDNGVFCPYRQLGLRGATQRRLMADPAMLHLALTSREVTRHVEQVTATHDAGCMAAAMGVAGDLVELPFMPVGRNEDGVFGAMLLLVGPDTLFGHLPHLVVHDSRRPSPYEPGVVPSAAGARLCDVIFLAVVTAASQGGLDPGRGSEVLAAVLAELAAADDVEIARWFEQRHRDRLAWQDGHLDAALREGLPEWREAVRAYRDEMARAVEREAFFVPMEYREAGSAAEAWTSVRRLLGRFSNLLRAWPAMLQAARAAQPSSSSV